MDDPEYDYPQREVRVCTKVTHVIAIDKQNQTFKVVVRFEASWIDKALAKVADRMGKEVQNLQMDSEHTNHNRLVIDGDTEKEELFTPRLRLTNLTEKDDEEMWYIFYPTIDGPPVICLRWKLTGVFQEVMELHRFPFDTQQMQMMLESGWPTDDKENGVILVKNQNSNYRSLCDKTNFVQTSEYELYERFFCDVELTERRLSATNKQYARLIFSFRVRRRSGYWWWNVLLLRSSFCTKG
jgi:hypothetical protein